VSVLFLPSISLTTSSWPKLDGTASQPAHVMEPAVINVDSFVDYSGVATGPMFVSLISGFGRLVVLPLWGRYCGQISCPPSSSALLLDRID